MWLRSGCLAPLPHRKRQGRPADLGDLPGTGGSQRAQGRQPVPGGKPRPYRHLDLPTDPQVFLDRIATALDQAARGAAAGLPRNGFAAVQDDRLKLKRPDALTIPRAVRQLRETLKASLPRVRIEDLLQDVDDWCGFTSAFQPLGGYKPRGGDPHRPLLVIRRATLTP